MSENISKDLIGDAGDALEMKNKAEVFKKSFTKTNPSSDITEKDFPGQVNNASLGNMEQGNTHVTSKASSKIKPEQNRSSLKVQPATDDLLQALCTDVLSGSTSTGKMYKDDVGIKQQVNKVPATDGASVNSKAATQNAEQNAPPKNPQVEKSVSGTKASSVVYKTTGDKPSPDKKCSPSIKNTEVNVSLPQVQKVTSLTNSGPSLLEIMSAGNTLTMKVKETEEKSNNKEKHSVTRSPSTSTVNPTEKTKSELKHGPKRENNVGKSDIGVAQDQSQKKELILVQKQHFENIRRHRKDYLEAVKVDGVKEKSSVLPDKTENSDSVTSSQKYQRVDRKAEEEPEMTSFSEEDLKNIDQYLVDQMVDTFVRQSFPPQFSPDARFKVKVSPLEIADLAESSVQNLIIDYPKMSLIFKRQIGKFKKKKGYSEISFTKILEVKDFVKKLIALKLVEKKIEVNISVWLSGNSQELSFYLSHRDNGRLMALINSNQDSQTKVIGSRNQKHQFDLVPSTTTPPCLQILFPFSSFVRISREVQENISGKPFIGPVFVHYSSPKYQEAVMECFSNFTIDGHRLKLLCDNASQNVSGDQEKDQSVRDRQKEKNSSNTSIIKPREEKEKSQQSESAKNEEKEDYEDDDDDDISNMTRDVCAGMLESLDKLKQLDANNPNIERILKMRDQLDKLQKSLGPQPKEKNKTVHGGNQEDPWEVGLQDVDDNTESFEKESMKYERKHSKDVSKSKHNQRHARSVSKEQDSNLVQAFESEHQQREKIRPVRSQSNLQGSSSMPRRKRNSSRQRNDDHAVKSYEQKVREEEELQRKKEEALKEAERIQLIQKIEEARLRDLKKAEERVQNRTIWASDRERRRESPFSHKTSISERHSSSIGSRDKVFDRSSNRSNKRSFEETKDTHDDGMDQRLAAFERELAEKGVIHPHSSPSKRPKSMDSDSFMTRESSTGGLIIMEDEYQNIIDEGRHHILPPDYRVRIQSSSNRQCPVKSCPDMKYFRDINSFLEHWSIFHVPETSMRFCQKCVAYFMSPDELEMHLEKAHWINPSEAQYMVCQARVKVISNPSYRDPKPYLPPLH